MSCSPPEQVCHHVQTFGMRMRRSMCIPERVCRCLGGSRKTKSYAKRGFYALCVDWIAHSPSSDIWADGSRQGRRAGSGIVRLIGSADPMRNALCRNTSTYAKLLRFSACWTGGSVSCWFSAPLGAPTSGQKRFGLRTLGLRTLGLRRFGPLAFGPRPFGPLPFNPPAFDLRQSRRALSLLSLRPRTGQMR